MWIHHPRESQLANAPHRDILVGRHPDGWMRLLHRTDRGLHAWQRVEPSVEFQFGFRPQTLDQFERLQKAGDPLLHADAVRGTLLSPITQSDPEDHATMRYRIERGDLLRDVHWIVQRQQEHG